MKTFVNCAAQGDILIRRVKELPKDVVEVKPKDGKFVVAHSETGHHHSVMEHPGVQYYTSPDPMVAYLTVIEDVEAKLEHERTFDTHETLLLKGGTYEIRRQREFVPEGWRRVED